MGAETPHWPCAENKEDLVKGSGPLRGLKINLRGHKIKIQIFLLHSIYDVFFFSDVSVVFVYYWIPLPLQMEAENKKSLFC